MHASLDQPGSGQLLAEFYRASLLDDCIPFWMRNAIDVEHGGYLTALDREGQVIDTDKSVWHQGRFCWMLGELFNNVEPREDWLRAAESGGRFLQQHCFDAEDGRMWFQVTRAGRPLRKRRYSFSESFASIAFGELAQATGNETYAQLAAECFERFRQHVPAAKFTDERPVRGIGHPMICIGTAQELRESIGLAAADRIIDESVATIRDLHMKPEMSVVLETVGMQGEMVDHFDGRLLNPGHAIEAAWFILREAAWRGNDSELLKLGLQILDWMWDWGWDSQYGGIIYFRDLKGYPPQEYWHDMKFWWPQNEAIIASVYAWLLTGDTKYARWHQQAHDWAHQHFADDEHGEWFGYLHRDGRLSHSAKGNMWKGPFHLPRMQLVCWKLLASGLSASGRESEQEG